MASTSITIRTFGESLSQIKSDQVIGRVQTSRQPDKIDKAARDFENILVGQWLEQAEKSFATVPGVDPDRQNDSTHDQFLGIACRSLSEELGRTGGLGIATMIAKALRANVTSSDESSSAPNKTTGKVINSK